VAFLDRPTRGLKSGPDQESHYDNAKNNIKTDRIDQRHSQVSSDPSMVPADEWDDPPPDLEVYPYVTCIIGKLML